MDVPNSLRPEWLESSDFESEFQSWLKEVNCFRHVFLGYSSKASPIANSIRVFLSEKLRVTIFDWHDFRPGDSIWDSIERAECLTNCGVFLFTADDRMGNGNKPEFAARDNVVYEAGYFAGPRAGHRSLIIREKGVKVPSDLGGILDLELTNQANVSEVETKLREHLERILEDQLWTTAVLHR